ncbi:hypothetical protein [Propioniferax innocua]|uniref:Uncharacterized protein n=1 Tax=Propioniferax innocua TaxID=1753 RepID=A0A542ZAF9_9ACTN|nr:hypothetical protein [Propioniferax innocua]TQL57328.1 hypothetical protein FB460_2405 [Propioniferax innocua]
MNANLRIFIAIFFFISGIVGVVLSVVNFNQQPMAVAPGTIFGVVGLVALVAGWLLVRKPRY